MNRLPRIKRCLRSVVWAVIGPFWGNWHYFRKLKDEVLRLFINTKRSVIEAFSDEFYNVLKRAKKKQMAF